MVNCAAIWGGSQPDDTSRRRRSIDADERGLEPTRRGAGLAAIGTTLRASINSASCCVASSSIAPAACDFQRADAKAANPDRGEAITAARTCSTYILDPASGPHRRKRSRSEKHALFR